MLAGLVRPPQQLLSKALFYVAVVHFPRASGTPLLISAAINQFSSPRHHCHFTSLLSLQFSPNRHTHPPNGLQLPFYWAREMAFLYSKHTHSLTHTSIKKNTLASAVTSNIKSLKWAARWKEMQFQALFETVTAKLDAIVRLLCSIVSLTHTRFLFFLHLPQKNTIKYNTITKHFLRRPCEILVCLLQ